MHTQATDLKRRREIEAVLRPRGGPVCAHLDRAVGLALSHRWTVTRAKDFAAVYATRTIETPPLETDIDFCCFLHEGAHLDDPHFPERPRTSKQEPQGQRVSLEAEAFAWLWTIAAAGFRWNTQMQTEMTACLRTYATYADTWDDIRLFEAVVAHGADQGVVRLRPKPIDPRIADLLACVDRVTTRVHA